MAIGITKIDPEGETVPTLGLMEIVFAPVTSQVNVVLSPNVIALGLEEKELITGGVVLIIACVVLGVSTVTVTDLVILPLPLSAVNV